MEEVAHTSSLHPNCRCWKVVLKYRGRKETFKVYSGYGWSSYPLDLAFNYLLETQDGNYPTYAAWDKDNFHHYSKEIGPKHSRLYWTELHRNFEKLSRLFGAVGLYRIEQIVRNR